MQIRLSNGSLVDGVALLDGVTGEPYKAGAGGSLSVSVDSTDVIASQDATTAKVEELRQQLVTLLGDEESIKALASQTNTLLTTLGTYNDQVEGLLGTVGGNTENLQTLLTQLGLNTDQLETLLQSVATKLDTIHNDLVAENTSLTALNTSIGAVTTAVNAVTTAVAAVKTSIDAGNVSESTIATQTASLSGALADIKDLISSGNSAIGILHTDGVNLQGLITTGNTTLAAIQTANTAGATAANQEAAKTALDSLNAAATSELTTLNTIATNITALGATLGAGKTLADIVTAVNANAKPADVTALQTALTALENTTNTTLANMYAKMSSLHADGGSIVHVANFPTGGAQDGTDATAAIQPSGGSGIRGWLSGIYTKLSGSIAVTGTFWPTTQPISATALPLPVGASQDGTDASGITAPSGGVGIRGWLSGIYSKLSNALVVSQSTAANLNATVSPAASSTWAGNISQVNGVAVNVGIGAAGTGTQRVSVSSDSKMQVWDGVNGLVLKAASTAPATSDASLVVTVSPNSPTIPVQIVSATTPTQATFSAIISTLILASSTARKSLSIFNDFGSGQTLYLLAGTGTASPTNYTYALVPGGVFVAQPQEVGYAWTGIFAATPSKSAQVTSGQ